MNTNTYCPTCGVELDLMSTTNEWIYKCPQCRERYNKRLEQMPDPATESAASPTKALDKELKGA